MVVVVLVSCPMETLLSDSDTDDSEIGWDSRFWDPKL